MLWLRAVKEVLHLSLLAFLPEEISSVTVRSCSKEGLNSAEVLVAPKAGGAKSKASGVRSCPHLTCSPSDMQISDLFGSLNCYQLTD